MSEALDKVLAAHDHDDRIKYFLRATVGLSEAAAADTARAQSEKFKFDSGVLSFMGKPADKDGFVAWAKDNERAYLLPPDSTTTNTSTGDAAPKLPAGVNAATLAQAKAGNVSAIGQLFLQCGKDRAKMDALLGGEGVDTSSHGDRREKARDALRNDAGQFTDDPAKKFKGKNPWSAEGWNVTEQGRIFRLPNGAALAASLSKAAGSFVGATKAPKAA
jgi:hypothetical protein